jgi:hypothetical protein
MALVCAKAPPNLPQMFVMFHLAGLDMIAAAGGHPDRIAALRPGQKRYNTRLVG